MSPHHTMTCTDVGGRRESHGWHGLLRSGRVVGSREGGGSSTATGLVRLRVQTWVALATANGQACEQESDERRRKSKHGGTGTSHSRTAPGTTRAIGVDKAGLLSWRLRAGRFVGRRLGDSAPRWPAGSPVQWQRPRMRGCVMWRNPTTEPSRGRLRMVDLKPLPQLPP